MRKTALCSTDKSFHYLDTVAIVLNSKIITPIASATVQFPSKLLEPRHVSMQHLVAPRQGASRSTKWICVHYLDYRDDSFIVDTGEQFFYCLCTVAIAAVLNSKIITPIAAAATVRYTV